MMLKKIVLWVMAMTIALMGVGACAMPIHFEDGARSINVAAVSDANDILSLEDTPEMEAIDLQDFQLLSVLDDDSLLIFANGAYYRADASALSDIFEQVGEGELDMLTSVDELEPINRGAKSEGVQAVQEAMIALGYLTGSADGQYGSKSQKAVAAFRADMGLTATDTVDQLLQLLIESACENTVNIVADYDPSMRYPELAGKTSANLAAIAEYGLVLNFDDVAGTGILYNDSGIVLDASGDSDVDYCVFQLMFDLRVNMDNDGEAAIAPELQVYCECVRRPIVQEVIIKSGDYRCSIPISDLKSELSGVLTIETASAKLDSQALKVLANAEDAGELKFRINCKYASYDGEASTDLLHAISSIGKAGQAL